MIPPAICMVLLGPVSGRLSDRFGWRMLTLSGLGISATGAFLLAANLTESSSVLFIVLMMMLQACGMALFNSPNNSSVLGAVERTQYGVVSSLTQLVRNSANVTSIAIATTIVVVTMASYGVEPSLDAVSPACGGCVRRRTEMGVPGDGDHAGGGHGPRGHSGRAQASRAQSPLPPPNRRSLPLTEESHPRWTRAGVVATLGANPWQTNNRRRRNRGRRQDRSAGKRAQPRNRAD